MLPNAMNQARSRAAAAMGRAKTPAKAVAARKNAAKATRARLLDQTPEWADCAIISLGVYLGVPYTDVIRVAARVVEDGGRHGLTRRTLKKIAALFEAPLRVRKTFDPDESYGIVWATKPAETSDHCAVLRNGLVLDRLTVWEWADWLADQRVTAAECVLLVVKE